MVTDGREKAIDYGPMGPSPLLDEVVRILGEHRWGRVRAYWRDSENHTPGAGYTVNEVEHPGWVDVEFSDTEELERLPRNGVAPAIGVDEKPDNYKVPKKVG